MTSDDENTVDLALLLMTSAYALWLDKHRAQEPDWTWVEVVFGTALCLGAAALRQRLGRREGWRAYEKNVWRAFALGGAPIIAGELTQALRDRKARDEYMRPWRR